MLEKRYIEQHQNLSVFFARRTRYKLGGFLFYPKEVNRQRLVLRNGQNVIFCSTNFPPQTQLCHIRNAWNKKFLFSSLGLISVSRWLYTKKSTSFSVKMKSFSELRYKRIRTDRPSIISSSFQCTNRKSQGKCF